MCGDPQNCELLKLKNDLGLVIDDFADYKSALSAKFKESSFMSTLYLFRNKDDNFGKLYYRGVFLADTLENPLYRFPSGFYGLNYTWSPKFNGYRFEITGIPGRSRILLHEGNLEKHSTGCVLVGVRKDKVLQYSVLTLQHVNIVLNDCSITKIFVKNG